MYACTRAHTLARMHKPARTPNGVTIQVVAVRWVGLQGWVQLHKITSITITFKYKFQLQLQLHLHNVIINYNYNYTMFISITITITHQFFSRKLHIYLWNFLLIDLGCFPDIWYDIMCGTRNHSKQGCSIILVQNAHVNFLFFFTWILYKWCIKKKNRQS